MKSFLELIDSNPKYPMAIIIIAILLFPLSYFSSDIAINDNGEIDGVYNNIRAALDEEGFWNSQQTNINASILRSKPEKSIRETFKDIDKILEEHAKDYNKIDQSRELSIAKQKAELLREKANKLYNLADDIEMEEFFKKMDTISLEKEKNRLLKIKRLEKLRTLVKSKLSSLN